MKSKNLEVQFTVSISEEYNWRASGQSTTKVVISPEHLDYIDPGNILLNLMKAAHQNYRLEKSKKEQEDNEEKENDLE